MQTLDLVFHGYLQMHSMSQSVTQLSGALASLASSPNKELVSTPLQPRRTSTQLASPLSRSLKTPPSKQKVKKSTENDDYQKCLWATLTDGQKLEVTSCLDTPVTYTHHMKKKKHGTFLFYLSFSFF